MKALTAREKAIQAARSNFDQIVERYRVGLATLLERTDADGLLTNAEIELAVARFQLERARLVLQRAKSEAL